MNNLIKVELIFIFFGFILAMNTSAQNIETMLIEKMEQVSLVIPEKCTPDDMIIIVNSSLQDLKFESNMLPNEEFIVTYNQQSNQYIICHEKIKFKLTISGPNLQSEEIEIFDLDKPLAYRISANIAKGKVSIITNPRNATVIFPELNNLALSSNQPITNVSGKYRINIVKPQYKNIDTTIIIPRDAEKTYNFDLTPLFSRIKLDLKTDDNLPFVKTPVLWVDSVKIDLDALVKKGTNQRSFFDEVEFLKFYEGNIIPISDGTHNIKIEAEGYVPYKATIEAKNANLHNISLSLEPIFGYLTFVDTQFAEGANIFIDDKNIGKIPLFKVKTRVGNHKIRYEKLGFASKEKEYAVLVQENQNTDIDVSMLVAKKIRFESEPSNAEVLIDGTRIGFTPFSDIINAGNHQILVRKSGFASEKLFKKVNELSLDEETLNLKLRPVMPLLIISEQDSLSVNLKGLGEIQNIDFENSYKTPATMLLPYGKYKISLSKESKIVYKSTINHFPEILKQGKLPNYSRSSFHILTGNYMDQNNFEASFGRILIFPNSGLSSSLINVEQRLISNDGEGSYSFEDIGNYNRLKDSIDLKTLAPYFFFMNWDWRIGGSIIRQLDINFLGRIRYTPGLKSLGGDIHIPGYSDVSMRNYFYGIEISSRLSYANLSFRFGRQINNGNLNYWNNELGKYTDTFPIKENQFVASLGITINGKVYKSNNMLRIWNKPLIDIHSRKSANRDSKSSISNNSK